ncbi:MAG: putative DNA-binding domain-containing protein [Halobacteriovoraceae bacterium]|nr:putative DNA-binding domain-containing protein [Halobacteriovoraceae bacterium]MCB9095394.1 putative DNA-binding domain-containing protein [Halobacteriovoraceae bacterium]
MNLEQYQKSLVQGIYHKEDNALELGFPRDRFQMYRSFIHGHYQSALTKMFPRLSELRKIPWIQWSQEYYQDYPPHAYELNDLAKNFHEFMNKKYEVGEVKDYEVELVQYELTEFQVFRAPFEVEKDSLSLQLNPTLAVLEFAYDIPGWVYHWEREGQALQGEPVREKTLLAIARNPETELPVFTKLPLMDYIMIKMLESVKLSEDLFIESIQKESEGILSLEDIQAKINNLKKQWIVL